MVDMQECSRVETCGNGVPTSLF